MFRLSKVQNADFPELTKKSKLKLMSLPSYRPDQAYGGPWTSPGHEPE